jgi:hypothetical protein
MWNFSMLFIYLPLLVTCITSITSRISPYACPVFSICWAYVEVSLLCFVALMCTLYRMLNDLPVWPIYSRGQSLHLSLYIPLCSYVLFPCYFCCTCLCMLFVILYATFKFVFLNILVIFLTSCPKYVNVVHLSFACLFPCSFSFGGPLFFFVFPV